MSDYFENLLDEFDFFNSPLDKQDMDWLIYIWHMSAKSYGMETQIDKSTVPQKLKETAVFSHLFERLTYYKNKENLIKDFEEREDDKIYYILLSEGFLDAVNRYIRIDFQKYDLLEPYKERAIMNNSINVNNFNGNLAIQQGNQNSKQENEFLSHKDYAELEDILENLLNVVDNNVKVSNNALVDEINDLKQNIIELRENLRNTSPKKNIIKQGIDNILARLVTVTSSIHIFQAWIDKLQDFVSNISF